MEITIRLFDPGMNHLHRVGLAGLYMSLKYFDRDGRTFGKLKWKAGSDFVSFSCDDGATTESFQQFFQESFRISKYGLIDLAGHRDHPMGDIVRVFISESIRKTYLQLNKQNMIPKGTSNKTISYNLEDQNVLLTYKPFSKPYAHCKGNELILTKKGQLKTVCTVKNWLYPGAAVRHSGMAGTEIEETPEKLLSLLFAPMATLYYRVSHRGLDGKRDKRKSTAILLPHIVDLKKFHRCFTRYLAAPFKRLSADGLGDAALSALIDLKADDDLDSLGITGCTVLTMGTATWSKQQQSRTALQSYEGISSKNLELFDLVCRCLPNKVVVMEAKKKKKAPDQEPTFFVATSLSRGLVAENIATNRDWFSGFYTLMQSKQQAKLISFERGGLKSMAESIPWPFETDKQFVEAVHDAIRSRYGALASRAKASGETIQFAREYERMRTGLMRAKNLETLRAELSDFFARGGSNKTLRQHWKDLLPLFSGEDWQRARDLALFALASYAGKGVEQIEVQVTNAENGEEA
jgi:CRISPR-associated protein Cas8a1/Csx13